MPENEEDTSANLLGEIQQGPSKFDQFLEKNQKLLAVVAAVLVLLVAGFIVMRGLGESKRLEASGALAQADDVAKYQDVASTYSGSSTGGTAMVLAANAQWEEGKKEEAITTFKSYLSDYPDHPAYGATLINLSGKLLNSEKYDEAKKYLKEAVSLADPSFSVIAEYLLAERMILEGDPDGAVAALEKLLKKPDSEIKDIKPISGSEISEKGVEELLKEINSQPVEESPSTDGTPSDSNE